VDIEQFEHRDSRSQFVAYVPKGSIAKGELFFFIEGLEYVEKHLRGVQILWDDEFLLSHRYEQDWDLVSELFAEIRRRKIPEISLTQIRTWSRGEDAALSWTD
jgi:hypothetical protein